MSAELCCLYGKWFVLVYLLFYSVKLLKRSMFPHHPA